jgi:hypothetical protein
LSGSNQIRGSKEELSSISTSDMSTSTSTSNFRNLDGHYNPSRDIILRLEIMPEKEVKVLPATGTPNV